MSANDDKKSKKSGTSNIKNDKVSNISKKTKESKIDAENNIVNENEENLQEINYNDRTNPEKVVSTRAYLEQNVTAVVQEAFLELARKRPPNPLEYLGNYILNRAKAKK